MDLLTCTRQSKNTQHELGVITAKATNHYHYLQGFGYRFTASRTKLVPSQLEGGQGCVRLPQNTAEKRKIKLVVMERAMTMNIGLTSRAFPRALPASASSLLSLRSSSVMLVFTCAQKCMHNNDVILLAVMERERERERAITTKATNHYHYLQGFGDHFAGFRTKLIPSQVEGDQGCVRLP